MNWGEDNGEVAWGLLDSVGGKEPSCNGHGTLEILEVIKLLESNNITCCITGNSALIYYGAAIMRGVCSIESLMSFRYADIVPTQTWEICVPTEQLEIATSIVRSHNYAEAAWMYMYYSLLQIFPRFKCEGMNLFFCIVSSKSCHMECNATNFERSKMGLPYPRLEVFTQSLLDTGNHSSLTDLVDGMNLSEDWGKEALDLSGLSDAKWQQWKYDTVMAYEKKHYPDIETDEEYVARGFDKAEMWAQITGEKQHRCGVKYPTDIYATRFRFHNQPDPRTQARCVA